eukprot:6430670-Prymnesium_polylepis.1
MHFSDANNDPPASECQATGNALFKEGRLEDAVRWYARALVALMRPRDVDVATVSAVLCNRSAALGKMGQHHAACDDAAEAAALQPAQVKPHYRHACALRALGRHEDAVAACDKGLALSLGHAQLTDVRRACSGEIERRHAASPSPGTASATPPLDG